MIHKDSKGFALLTVIFMMAILSAYISTDLSISLVKSKIAGNFKLATRAVQVADAGLQHALAVTPWVWDFDDQLNCGTPPCTLVSTTSFPAGSGFSYTVTAENDILDINTTGTPKMAGRK